MALSLRNQCGLLRRDLTPRRPDGGAETIQVGLGLGERETLRLRVELDHDVTRLHALAKREIDPDDATFEL